jgi:pyrimidine operon attenuation protein / uracil phosphoribosyltransferase
MPSRANLGGRPAETVQLLGKEEFSSAFQSWLAQIRKAVLGSAKGGTGTGTGTRTGSGTGSGASISTGSGTGSGTRQGPWALVGIKRRGAVLARRLWKELSSSAAPLLYGEVDISLYRDDYHLQTGQPEVLGTEISFAVDGVNILLVDDVLYTGRTVRAAMDLILDFGRPRVISLAVFIDRGHRELPIAANFVGKEVKTGGEDQVRVKLTELKEEDGVELLRYPHGKAPPGAPSV